MFAGSVTSSTSRAASAMRTRVFSSLCAYSSSGNAAIHHLRSLFSAEQQALEHTLGNLEIFEVDPLVGPVSPLLYIPRSEQDAWYPRRMYEEARVTGCAPSRDPARELRRSHRGAHRPYQFMLHG